MSELRQDQDTTGSAPTDSADARIPPLVGVAWGLLVINTLGSQGAVTIFEVPQVIFQLVTMGSMIMAFILALAMNPRLRIRPSAFLLLLTLLLVVSTIASARLDSGTGAVLRCIRLALFLATLWLLSRWWHHALAFVRYHVLAFGVVLLTVTAGLVISPSMALPDFYDGRLVGAVWPMAPPQIGQYAAVTIGLVTLLWVTKQLTGKSALWVIGPALVLLLLSHTRTATIGLLVALAVAGLSLLFVSRRARRAFTVATITAGVAAVAFGSAIQEWIHRGQDEDAFSNLTGRQKVWDALLAAPRTTSEYWLGVGLTNKSYGGLPIDSSWLAVYYEQGLIGIGLVVAFLTTLVVVAALRPPGIARACALFLITYTVIASYTEAGLGDASPYLLHLTVAAALLSRTPSSAAARRTTTEAAA